MRGRSQAPLRGVLRTLLAILGVVAAATAHAQSDNPYPGYVSAIYSDTAHWVCRPDKDDACDHDLDATAINADGSTQVEPFVLAPDPAVDCFYLYPTISTDPTGNSDFNPGQYEEVYVTQQQAARFGQVCRVFAPVYRQVTLTALTSALTGTPIPSDSALADADILDAWKHYIANDNQGRGVILIGHSQGSFRLTTLLRNEIDTQPTLRSRLVSAILLGGNFQVPDGADVGAALMNIPLCHTGDQTGCVVAYSSFRSTAPPPANSYFGGSAQAGWRTACTNPAELASGTTSLHPYFPTNGRSLPLFPLPPPPPWDAGVSITTPAVTLPDFLDGACREQSGFTYLEITVHGDPSDPRIDDIGGDLTPEWGLHLVDANVAMGDLVTIAQQQADAYQAAHQTTPDDGCAIAPHTSSAHATFWLIGIALVFLRLRLRA